MRKTLKEDFHEMEVGNPLEAYECLGMLCEIQDENIPYKWWAFKHGGTYIAAWDIGNGWWLYTYFEVIADNQDEALELLSQEIFSYLSEEGC